MIKLPSLFKKTDKQDIEKLAEIRNFTPFFKNEPVSKEDMGYILSYVKYGIKRESQEPLSFVFIENNDLRELLKNKYQQKLFTTAPVVICILGCFSSETEKLSLEKQQQYLWFQAGSAITNMCLAAAKGGLGFWYEEYTNEYNNVKKLIGADVDKYYLLGFCFIGKQELQNLRPREIKDSAVFFEKFGKKERANKSEYFNIS
ncbi:MAG: hypothetical protein CVU81_00585 [Euryarchaeota archaeon HGW-Euryarchaeota-1]|nr:MAG: hypothetical protein CVU81_00585 [Euryarchaeota archaeon HGW-Euryarchaeota-1]